jgi:hypothetical protein
MQIGYKLAAEAFGPAELIRQAVEAERAGFDFVEISDHFHPWLDNQGHSPFAWTVLGEIAAKTEKIGLATAWATDEHTAAQAALEMSRWAVTGWKVMSELPNPVNFAAASATVREDDILAQFACGSDVSRYVRVTQQFVDAGFDHLVMQNAGPDPG